MAWVGKDDDARLEAVHGTWSDRTRVTRSLLMIAAEKGHFMLTEALLRRGAKPNWQSCDGHSALTLAVTGTCDRREQGRSKVVRALLVGGADANHRIGGARGRGDTALMIAARHGRKHLVGTLLFHGAAQVDQHDSEGWTALMGAAHNGCPDVVRHLLRAGADASLCSSGGQTALSLAQRWTSRGKRSAGHSECVGMLRKHQRESGPVGGGGSSSVTGDPTTLGAATVEDEAATHSPNVIGRGADIVSQGSAPASSSRTARSPSLSDSLRDSAADRPLASPPSVADAASEDEAAALSPNVIGRGADIVSQGSAPAGSSRTARSP